MHVCRGQLCTQHASRDACSMLERSKVYMNAGAHDRQAQSGSCGSFSASGCICQCRALCGIAVQHTLSWRSKHILGITSGSRRERPSQGPVYPSLPPPYLSFCLPLAPLPPLSLTHPTTSPCIQFTALVGTCAEGEGHSGGPRSPRRRGRGAHCGSHPPCTVGAPLQVRAWHAACHILGSGVAACLAGVVGLRACGCVGGCGLWGTGACFRVRSCMCLCACVCSCMLCLRLHMHMLL